MLWLVAFALIHDPVVTGYVERVSHKLAPNVAVTVTVDDRKSAGASSEGVVVTTGLIAGAENESELAGILAHQAAHARSGGVCARFAPGKPDSIPQMKEAEREADQEAILILTKAGYEPLGMLRYFSRIRRAEPNLSVAFSAEDILLERLQLEATDHPLKDPVVDTADFRMIRERLK